MSLLPDEIWIVVTRHPYGYDYKIVTSEVAAEREVRALTDVYTDVSIHHYREG